MSVAPKKPVLAALTRSSVAGLRAVRRSTAFLPLAAGIASFVLAALVLGWATHARPVLHMRVAFGANACCAWQVWVGGAVTGDITVLPLTSGTNADYTVPIYRARFNQLFITVGTQPGGTARIERVWITRGTRTVDELTPAELQAATVYQAQAKPVGDGLELHGTGTQPAINSTVSLDTHESAARVFLARLVSQRLVSFAGAIVIGAVLLILLASRRRGRIWVLPASILGVMVAVRGLPWLSWRLTFHDDVTRAVGYASYVGQWKSRERFILDLACLLAVAIAAVCGFAFTRRRGTELQPESRLSAPDERPLPRLVSALFVVAPVVAIALAAVPNLRLYIGAPPQYTPSFDANNYLFSEYLVQTTHLEPVKDFFWLYGFQWLFDKAAPWGLVISYGWFLLLWTFLAIGTYVSLSRFFSGRSLLVRYLLLTGIWLTADLTSDLVFTTRYVAPLGTLLLFAGIDRRDSWWSWKRAIFTLALFNSMLFEPAQALYALAPICFLIVVEFITDIAREQGVRLSWLLKTAAPVVVALAAGGIVYWQQGIASATVSYYRALTLASSAYAFPSLVDQWVTHPTDLAGLILWAVPLTLAIGVTGLFLRGGRARSSYAITAALGLLGFMLMQKQILRPHAETQIWLSVVFGLAYWAVSDTLLSPTRRWSLLLGIAGAATALVVVSGGYRQAWRLIEGGPDRLSASAGALIHDRATFTRQARLQWGTRAFARFTAYKPVVAALEHNPRVARGAPVWVLGDDTAITMMLGKSWPYYFSDVYDTSPIDFQEKVIARLDRTPPARAVWNFTPSALVFDDVPAPVRAPLLYTWAVQHLRPLRRLNQFEILGPRPAGDPIDLEWWRRRIGKRVDLGHIPAATHLPSGSCKVGKACGSFLVVEFPKGAPHDPQIVVPVVINGLPFEIAFEAGPESRYVIPLDRVWFWAADAGGGRRISATRAGNATVKVVRRPTNANVLY